MPDKRNSAGQIVGTGLSYESSDNAMYDAYFKANPYVGQSYKKTLWDNLFEGIFRTGYDKWKDEMSLNSAQYNAGVVDLQQQNEYNSEIAKADRMRQAGENPDLLGTGDVTDSQGIKPDVQDAQIPEALDLSQVKSFAGMLGSCFSGAFAMAKQGIDLIGAMTDVDSANVDKAGKYQDLALKTIHNRIPAEGFTDDASYLSWIDGLYESPDLKWSQSLARSLGLRPWQRRSFDEAYRTAIGSLPAELSRFKDSNALAGERLAYARNTSSRYYDESMEVMKGVNDILVNNSDDLQELVSSNKIIEANAQATELENRGVEAGIQSEALGIQQDQHIGLTLGWNAVDDATIKKRQNAIDKRLKDVRKSILDFLEGEAKKGNSFATYMIHNMMLHEYMNFDFKTSLDAGIGKHLPNAVKGWLPNFGLSGEFGASM